MADLLSHTLPHLWITLLLVATDRDRRENNSRLLISNVLGLAVIVGGSYWSSELFLLGFHRLHLELMALANQHAGVLRSTLVKLTMAKKPLNATGCAWFIVYTILRTARRDGLVDRLRLPTLNLAALVLLWRFLRFRCSSPSFMLRDGRERTLPSLFI